MKCSPHITINILSEENRAVLKFCIDCKKLLHENREVKDFIFPGENIKKYSYQWICQQVLINLRKKGFKAAYNPGKIQEIL